MVAVGLLEPGGVWVGFVREADGYRIAFGAGPGSGDEGALVSPAEAAARRAELLAVAVAYFEEALDAPPPDIEATQADLAELVRWLAASEGDASRRARLDEAVDAIDDGLAGDVVVSRLSDARVGSGPLTNEQADVVDLLGVRYQALRAPSA